MATLVPEQDIANALVASSLFNPPLVLKSSVAAGDVGLGPYRAPANASDTTSIWVMPYGGAQPEPLVNAAVDGSIYRSKVQITVRSQPNDYTNGIITARKVRDSLHTKQSAGYIYWMALSSEPLYLGIDELQQHRWSVNIEAAWQA